MDIENKDLKTALANENIRLLKSDNICIGGKISLPDGMIGIIAEEQEVSA